MVKEYFKTEKGVLYHGDCLEVMQMFGDETVNIIWTDPPYGHNNHAGDLNSVLNGHRGLEDKPIANDGADEMRDVVSKMLKEASRVLTKDSCCCCCCCGGGGPKPTFAWLANRMDGEGLQFFHSVIWDKVNPGLGWRFRRQHEMVMVAHRTGGKLLWKEDGIAIPNLIRESKPRDDCHPNVKPVKLVMRMLEVIAKPDSIVLDPFFGSGTTGLACEKLGLQWIGCELDEKYCEVAKRRITEETDQLKLF